MKFMQKQIRESDIKDTHLLFLQLVVTAEVEDAQQMVCVEMVVLVSAVET